MPSPSWELLSGSVISVYTKLHGQVNYTAGDNLARSGVLEGVEGGLHTRIYQSIPSYQGFEW